MGLLDGILDAVGISSSGVPWGSIASAVGGFLGTESTNESNQQIAQQGTQFSAEQAQRQMDFQERMSNTAMQRRVSDLKAAGLNPMLAYNEGASSPGGASGTATVLPRANPALGAIQGAQTAAQIQNLQADTSLKKATEVKELASAGQLDAVKDNIRQEMQSFEQRMKKLGYETDTEWWRQQAEKYKAGILNSEDQAATRYFADRALKMANEARMLGLKIPEGIREAAFFSSEMGKVAVHFKHGAPSIDKLVTGSMTKTAEGIDSAIRNNNSAFSLKMSNDQARIMREYRGAK